MRLSERTIYRLFRISIILKALNGAIELLIGIFLLILGRQAVRWLIIYLADRDFVDDPRDILAQRLVHALQNVSLQSEHFAALYLIAHGVLKIVIVMNLLKKKYWTYPFAIAILFIFVTYELHRFSHTHSITLFVFALFDLVIMGLIFHEYLFHRRHPDMNPEEYKD